MRLNKRFDWKVLGSGDIVKTAYGNGIVIETHGEKSIELYDGSGVDLYKAQCCLGSLGDPFWAEVFERYK